jgi:hypothetical protein
MSMSKYEIAGNYPVALNEAETAAFIQASKAILGGESFLQTARIIFDQARSITGATAGYVALLSPEGDHTFRTLLYMTTILEPDTARRCSVMRSVQNAWRNLYGSWKKMPDPSLVQ